MNAHLRQREILDLVSADGRVSVEGLATHFGVTVQTIRRDLGELDDAGELQRVHGGAVPASGVDNIAYRERRTLAETEKAAIARACAASIPDNCSLFLNIGTTTEAVARELLNHRNLTVITNNLNVANILQGSPHTQVMLTGGVLRPADGGLVGDLARRVVEQFKVDIAVIGASALDADGDLLDYDLQEVGVSAAIIACARQVFLVADSSKFSRGAPARIASLRQVDRFFCDAVPEELQARCREWDTEVVLCTGDRLAAVKA